MRQRKANRRKNLHYLMLKVAENTIVKIPVKTRNATSTVTLNRSVADLQKGDEGLAISCANAQCALRENSHAFPHPVFLAEFTDKRAYIVDKLDRRGVPMSCVVYHHDQGKFQKQYDTKKKNSLVKMSGVEKAFTLVPPYYSAAPGQGTSKDRGHSGTPGAERERKRRAAASRGATARARRAGITIPVDAVKSA